jgi:hypothetical protein
MGFSRAAFYCGTGSTRRKTQEGSANSNVSDHSFGRAPRCELKSFPC